MFGSSPHLKALLCLLFVGCTACGAPRIDVKRNGQVKLYGEKPIKLEHKDKGDLLQSGIASWYGVPYHGRQTSSGEVYDMWHLTAAHKSLPFGSHVRVVNQENGKEVVVKINDRGPFVRGRVIDLSRKAAEAIGLIATGVAEVKLYLAQPGEGLAKARTDKPPKLNPTAKGADFYWTVQVGSFKDSELARAQAERFRKEGEVFTETHGEFTRVRVGKFSERAAADRLALRLYDEGVDCWIAMLP